MQIVTARLEQSETGWKEKVHDTLEVHREEDWK
jgi:hypothetical protein